jgi:hypothetical protein
VASAGGGGGGRRDSEPLDDMLAGNHTSVSVGDPTSPVKLEALVDPLSRSAQIMAPLLMFLSQRLNVQVQSPPKHTDSFPSLSPYTQQRSRIRRP